MNFLKKFKEFQPLLMKYFTENELVEMKNVVIKSHIQQRKSSPFTSQFSQNKSIGAQKTMIDNIDHFSKLPTEILMKIFSRLDLRDKLKSACVSKSWNQLVFEKFIIFISHPKAKLFFFNFLFL